MSKKEAETVLHADYLQKSQGETKTVLDYLRRTRASRGGTGAPLEVPAHLRVAAEGKPSIIITDDDLKPSTPITRD